MSPYRLTLLVTGMTCMIGCDRYFYYPTANVYATPREFGLVPEEVRFPARDGVMLHGWMFRAEGEPVGTVLHLHGNAGNITGHFPHVAWLPARGWNVLTFDYRGYGESDGQVTREGTIHDAHGALDFLLGREDVNPERLVAFGQSLGGAVGIVLAAEREEIRGLASHGAFDHYRRIAAWHIRRSPLLFALAWWVPPILMSDTYNPIDDIARIAPRPVFIMHGTADRVVDPAMAQRLHDAAGEPKALWLVEDADHYGPMEEHAEEAHRRLLHFFESAVEATVMP